MKVLSKICHLFWLNSTSSDEAVVLANCGVYCPAPNRVVGGFVGVKRLPLGGKLVAALSEDTAAGGSYLNRPGDGGGNDLEVEVLGPNISGLNAVDAVVEPNKPPVEGLAEVVDGL